MRILLIGNYAPDRQESMLRYASIVQQGLARSVHEVRLVAPRARLDVRARGAVGAWKWVGYADKLLLAPADLARAARWADVVHVCDHSNAFYVPARSDRPWVVTCHDLLALRGALGEDTDCPASPTGRILQRLILAGLRRAQGLVADSQATLLDVARVVARPRTPVATIAPPLNYPYRVLPPEETDLRLAAWPVLRERSYVLLVGSNLRRKNRECALRVLGTLRDCWPGIFVFAGEPLSEPLRRLAVELRVQDRVLDMARPSGEQLEALYNRALALLFPSRFEGFGWPMVEAQACGCPVIASDAPPMPEVGGPAAIVCRLDDVDGFAAAIRELAGNPAGRAARVARGLEHAARFDVASCIDRLVNFYESVR